MEQKQQSGRIEDISEDLGSVRPQQQLRVISNYSSLQRMQQKSAPRKLLPFSVLKKKESFQIAAWQYSPSKQKKKNIVANMVKIKTVLQNRVTPVNTITSERNTSIKKIKNRSIQPQREKIMMTTNFRIGHRAQKSQKISTGHLPQESLDSSRFGREKWRLMESYIRESSGRRLMRGVMSGNPQCEPSDWGQMTEYPLLDWGRLAERGRLKKKSQFFGRFLS